MIDDPHRFLFIGAGTKTGKTVAAAQYIVEGIAQGQRCAWAGPFYERTKTGYGYVHEAFKGAIQAGIASDSGHLSIKMLVNGGSLTSFSGDNPAVIYGDAFDRIVIDEATRHPEAVWTAFRTTVTATGGSIRVAFNTDEGRRQWAIREFERARAGQEETYGFINLPTERSPYVPREEVEQARRTLPERVFRAMYMAEVQEDGAGVFRRLYDCYGGPNIEINDGGLAPRGGATYVIGMDVARKHDWTVMFVMDVSMRPHQVVCVERMFGVPWVEQVRRAVALQKRYNFGKLVVDATGVGDPVCELLMREGAWIEPVVITGQMKTEIVERGIVWVEQKKFRFGQRLLQFINEMEAFEYRAMPSGYVAYGAPEGYADDTVLAFLLAAHGARNVEALMCDYQPVTPGLPHTTHPWGEWDTRVTI